MIETIRPPSDIKLALYYIKHIEHPCSYGDRDNRSFWIGLAERAALPFMKDTFAKSLLEDTIAKYKTD